MEDLWIVTQLDEFDHELIPSVYITKEAAVDQILGLLENEYFDSKCKPNGEKIKQFLMGSDGQPREVIIKHTTSMYVTQKLTFILSKVGVPIYYSSREQMTSIYAYMVI